MRWHAGVLHDSSGSNTGLFYLPTIVVDVAEASSDDLVGGKGSRRLWNAWLVTRRRLSNAGHAAGG